MSTFSFTAAFAVLALALAAVAWWRGTRGAHVRVVIRRGNHLTIVNIPQPDPFVVARLLELVGADAEIASERGGPLYGTA